MCIFKDIYMKQKNTMIINNTLLSSWNTREKLIKQKKVEIDGRLILGPSLPLSLSLSVPRSLSLPSFLSFTSFLDLCFYFLYLRITLLNSIPVHAALL